MTPNPFIQEILPTKCLQALLEILLIEKKSAPTVIFVHRTLMKILMFSRWWFRLCFYPYTCGKDPIWLARSFQMGWFNHQHPPTIVVHGARILLMVQKSHSQPPWMLKKTCKQWDGQLPISTGDRLAWFHPSVSHDQIHIIKPQQSIESKEVFDALLGGVAGGRGGRPPKQEDFLKKTQTKKQREASTKTSCWWTSFVPHLSGEGC